MVRSSKALIAAFSFLALLLAAASGTAWAQGRKGVSIANGPFTYNPSIMGSATFLGMAGTPIDTGFTLCPPGGGTIFPAGGSNANAEIRVFDILKTGDANGNSLLEPVKVSLDSTLGSMITSAFEISPSGGTVYPGYCFAVDVTVYNPGVLPEDFGDYVVTIKAKATGSGIGVGSGSRFNLSLRAATLTDTTPPVVNILEPADGSTHILGELDVEVQAMDPAPGSGLAIGAITANISSAGGTVSNESIPLTDDGPKAAGETLTALGGLIPIGGGGAQGTTEVSAFTSSSPSGIGMYVISATATDVLGNTSVAITSAFQVKYDVQFTTQTGSINNGNPGQSNGHFKFTAKRSNTTSDGAFMYDQTVLVELRKTSDDSLVATHTRTSGSGVNEAVVFASDPAYETRFRRADIGVSAADNYYARVLFMDVDGNLVQQAVSNNVNF